MGYIESITKDTVFLTTIAQDKTVDNPISQLELENLPQDIFRLHEQPVRHLSATVQVFDENFQVMDVITGKVIDGSMAGSSTSMVRRTGTLVMKADDDVFPRANSLMWFNNVIRVWVGIEDNLYPGKTYNFLLGTFYISEANYLIDAAKNEIRFDLEDRMMRFEDLKLENPIQFAIGTPVGVAMRKFMEHLGETQFGHFEDSMEHEVVPYTLDFKTGDEVTRLITTLRDMYMDYYCGYNVRGEFEYKRIRIQREEDLPEPKWRFGTEIDDTKSLISMNENYPLKEVRNHVIVYGATSEINGGTAMGEVRVTDMKSPFNIYAIGDRKEIIINPKYAYDAQCTAHARYEVYKRAALNEIANIETVPIYILDLDDIITIRHPYTKLNHHYIIDSFSYGLATSSSMRINANKLYYVSLEYGQEKLPLVEALIRGISNWGWLSLGEERIAQCYNIEGSGQATVTVRFYENVEGGEQAYIQSYGTTKNQSFSIDIADTSTLDFNSQHGGYTKDSHRSKGDYLDRVFAHEMFHVVCNDYYGHSNMIQMPEWFKEGFAEFIHGAKERYMSVYTNMSQQEKKETLVELCRELLDNNFQGRSEDYVGSYLIAIAIYRLCSRSEWENLFVNLKSKANPGINFLMKLLPIADTNDLVKTKVIQELQSMDDVYGWLGNPGDKDTGSIGGIHFMNLFRTPLTPETVFNNANATELSTGFKIEFVK